MRSSSGGARGLRCAIGGTSSFRMFAIVEVADWPRKGLPPGCPRWPSRRGQTECEKIGARVHRFPFELFRSHVVHRADEQPCLRGERGRVRCRGANAYPGGQRAEKFGEAKIEDLYLAVGCHEDIGRFNIAMDDALRMRGIERRQSVSRRPGARRC